MPIRMGAKSDGRSISDNYHRIYGYQKVPRIGKIECAGICVLKSEPQNNCTSLWAATRSKLPIQLSTSRQVYVMCRMPFPAERPQPQSATLSSEVTASERNGFTPMRHGKWLEPTRLEPNCCISIAIAYGDDCDNTLCQIPIAL